MIPTIEDIVAGLRGGTIGYDEAIHWLSEHKRLAALRDEFAANAMSFVVVTSTDHKENLREKFSRECYAIADAMLAERSKP
jgi:hypothetical protein